MVSFSSVFSAAHLTLRREPLVERYSYRMQCFWSWGYVRL